MMNSRPTKTPKPPRGPFKGLREVVGRVLGSKAFLMAVSFLAALFFWSVLVASDGSLTRQKTFANVAVSVTGESGLKSQGFIVMEDLSALVPGVKMTVEVTQANYNRVSGTSYNPYIDLAQIKNTGEAELKVNFSSTLYGPVVDCQPSTVKVNVERYITRRVPVVVDVKGELKDYYLDSTRTEPSVLAVSGPASLVSGIARAVVTLDAAELSGERMSDRFALDVRLTDTSGKTVESDLIEITNQSILTRSVIVETELMPMADVPLALENFVTGAPAEGYELEKVEAALTHVAIAAQPDVLEAITMMTTDQPLNIEGATEDVSGYVRLRKPSGIENPTPYDVAITAKIREKTISRTLSGIPVEIDGLADALSAKLSRTSQTVQLTGGYAFIHALEKAQIRLFVDANDLGPGEHELPVQISIDNAPAFSCALSSPTVTLTIGETP